MKKIDKTVFITVVLAILGIGVIGDIITYQCSGWNSIILGGVSGSETIRVAFSIVVGLLLNIPIVMLLMRFFGKEDKVKNIAPILNICVIFVTFVLMVVQAALKEVWQAQSFAHTILELSILFVILDLCNFKHIIVKIQSEPETVEKAEPVVTTEPEPVETQTEETEEPAEVETEESEPEEPVKE